MMKGENMLSRRKAKVVILSSITAMLALILFITLSTISPVIGAVLKVNEDSFFFATYQGHQYKCYRFKDDNGNPVSGVAIAWGENPEDTPNTLELPSEVTNTETSATFTVRGIAPGGFRYCDFTKVIVPETVETIQEEAFAYCQKMADFDIPYLVEKIAPSTFLDCRALEYIYYTNSSGARVFGNNTITEIGDHAFDSCVSLRDFYCPKKLVIFGEACFQKCSTLATFYFPSTIKEGDVIQNYITVRPYAFAFCTNLTFVYFETNMKEIDDYAFVGCHTDTTTLKYRYNGTSVPTFKRDGVTQSHWRDKYITSSQTAKYDIQVKHPTISADELYPCIRYISSSDEVLLDSARDRRPTVTIIDAAENTADGEYAIIYKFDTPTSTVPGCFDVSTGALTIPDELDGKKVKVINTATFKNHPEIKSVSFNKSLVQIKSEAFLNCPNIESLDFTSCEKLKEVSYTVFASEKVKNEKITSLTLPDCLEYVGDYGFGNLTRVNNFHISSNMKAIADLAFWRMGNDIGDGNGVVDLTLPKSLNDQAARAANFYHMKKGSYSHAYTDIWCAVGKYAFEGAKCLRMVDMELDSAHENDNSYTTSLFSNAFKDCSSLVRFKSNKNLQIVGKDAFKGCKIIREIFLSSEKGDASNLDYPWCIDESTGKYGGTLFSGDACPELVLYVTGSKAPGLCQSFTTNVDATNGDAFQAMTYWNVETKECYSTDYQRSASDENTSYCLNRSHVPTYFNIPLEGGVSYWNPKTNQTASAPINKAAYDDGIVALAKNTSDEYTVARYYMSGTNGTGLVDLTKIPDISDNTNHKLKVIGDEAFATSAEYSDSNNNNKNKTQGLFFILPDTITEVSERAFMRKAKGQYGLDRYGVRVVSYKNSSTGKIKAADGTSELSESEFNTYCNAVPGTNGGYCVLPNNVTKIGINAFYNNIFSSVNIGSNLNFIGSGSFATYPISTSQARTSITSFTIGSNSTFGTSDGGIYYIGDADKKMLISQASNVTGTLSIASGTKAVGILGCANTKYSTINLPTGLTTIYGGAFFYNTKLTTVNGTSSLRYIGSMENATGKDNGWDDPSYTEVWDETVEEHFNNIDFRGLGYKPRTIIPSLYGAFRSNSNLTTMNFKAMTQLRKIGEGAFDGCSKLEYMTGGDTYTYLRYNGTSTPTVVDENINAGVLDLSGCANLRSINRSAFTGCNKIKYFHLPDNRGGASESTLYIGYDLENPAYLNARNTIISANKGTNILIKETVYYSEVDYGSNKHAIDHYGNKLTYFGGTSNNNNKLYYYVGSASDIPSSDTSSLNYWTIDTDGKYILFDTTNGRQPAVDARAYFAA